MPQGGCNGPRLAVVRQFRWIVAEWLRGLGLEQYAPAFRANDIDEEVLRRLTGEDLRELGVTSIGHRRRLLDAIAALGTAEALPTPIPPIAPDGGSPHPNPPLPGLAPGITGEGRVGAEAERRQLTVMFCDLVGSTALSARFDPEDLREIVGAYHRCVADTVGRFAGFVAKYMGDGVLVYFGYPEAHEDDAERAVRAGLAVIEAVGRLAGPEPLNVRLGIATGIAVVGDLIGEGAAQERGVVGETPNLAARLQALAAPNTLIIGEATRRQVGGLFDLADLGPQALAGFAEPQPAWRVIGESGMLSRFEALRSGETPLVGRDEEVELLLRRWQQAKSGEGRVVLISGEPGIGKSRLTAALSEQIGSRAAYPLALFLLAAPPGQRALSVHRPARTRRRVRARRHGRRRSSPSCGDCSHPSMRESMTKSSCWPSCCHCRVPPPTSTSARSANARNCSRHCSTSSKPRRGAGRC